MMRKFLVLLVVCVGVFFVPRSVLAWDVVPVNGNFSSGLDNWTIAGSNPEYCYVSGSEGHAALGALRESGLCWGISDYFVPSSSSVLSIWVRHSFTTSDLSAGVTVDCSGGGLLEDMIYFPGQSSSWTNYTWNLSAFAGQACQFTYRGYGNTNFYLDDVEISYAYNGEAVPTDTPSPTNTVMPTSTSIPTNTPVVGTPVSGGGSSGLCPSADPCYVIVQNTPLPVDLVGVGGTPVSGGGAIPVMNPTPQITPIDSSVAAGAVALGGATTYFSSASVGSGVIPIGITGGGSISDVQNVEINRQSFSFCLPGEVGQVINPVPCWSTDVFSLGSFTVAGVNVLPIFSVAGGAVLVVFIIRQLQER